MEHVDVVFYCPSLDFATIALYMLYTTCIILARDRRRFYGRDLWRPIGAFMNYKPDGAYIITVMSQTFRNHSVSSSQSGKMY